MKLSDFVAFKEKPNPGKKTKMWEVISTMTSTQLGLVAWFTNWRKHCFFPCQQTIFDQDCLYTIAEFVERQTKEHKP